MSSPEESAKNFLQRWSQRKRAAEMARPDGTEPDPVHAAPPDMDERPVDNADADSRAFDPVSLPSIDSITATTDIRAFLAPGVPKELARAALRRAWVTDPTVRDFVGLAENQWDFTKPDGVPGFGPLELTPELRRIVAELIGDVPRQISPQRLADTERIEELTEVRTELPLPTRALVFGEKDAGVERLDARDGVVASADVHANPVQVVPQDRDNDVALQQSIVDADRHRQSAPRKHGGAVPK
jgi:hypothetical protein